MAESRNENHPQLNRYRDDPGSDSQAQRSGARQAGERSPLMANSGSGRAADDSRRGHVQSRDETDVAVRDADQRGGRRESEDDDEPTRPEEIRYGAHSIVKLIVPVTICMAVVSASMLAITSFGSTQTSYLVYTPFHEDGTESGGQKFGEAILNVLIILVIVVVMTVVLVCLIKYRCTKAVTVWLVGASVLALGWFSVYYLEKIWKIYNIRMDWITAAIISWNFAVAGIFAIHWQGPLRVRQFSLVSTCVFIALIFIQFLPPWTGWVLLALIAVYDLVAVLTPCGPLRKLVELAQERDEPLLPSLVYSTTMMWTVGMADVPQDRPRSQARAAAASADPEREPLVGQEHSGDENDDLSDVEVLEESSSEARRAVDALGRSRTHATDGRQLEEGRGRSPGEGGQARQQQQDDDDEDKGVRLGLGDFIFYSILVGKATADSSGDWNVIIACFIAILIGLCMTTILLAILRKALPALPISIAFGLVFYFATKEVITPFTAALNVDQVYI